MTKIRRAIIGVLMITTMTCLLLRYRFQSCHEEVKECEEKSGKPPGKTILYWTPMFNEIDFNLGLGSEIFKGCTYNNCYATHNRTYLPVEEFDAILFHGVEYREDFFGKPQKRKPNQIYIYSNQESPLYTPRFKDDFEDFYNWTMTYRLDSEIPRPYGIVVNNKTNYQPAGGEEIKTKTKTAAWLVSNCKTFSQREDLYKKLAKLIEIDVFGSCGDLTCPKSTSETCYENIEKNYKFYLSFENSYCEDYVTEKLFNVLKRDVVPIVYGGGNYEKIAPKNSVINMANFRSPESLARYLKFLSDHPEEYLKYFEWKKNYFVDTSAKLTLCDLCTKLNRPIETKIYRSIKGWWLGKNYDKCKIPQHLEAIITNN